MNRQIKSKTIGLRGPSSPEIDDYKSRLVKMIPSEIVTLYMACHALLSQAENIDKHIIYIGYFTVFGVVLILMPIYLVRSMKLDDPTQIVMMMLSFILWSMTLAKPFDRIFENAQLQQLISTLLLTVYTFVAPLFYKGQK